MSPARLPSAPHRRGGTLVGVALVLAASGALLPLRGDVSRASPALVLVIPIVVAGLVAGRTAALVTAGAAALAFNFAFIPPYWTLEIHAPDDIVALVVFGFVAAVVGTLVAREGERRQSAEERAAELQAVNEELQAVQQERQRLAEEALRATVLEHVDQQRAALLRSVSHDLRTPLAAVRAVVSDLLSGAPYDDATRSDLLGLVADEVERLDRLVANLLSLSRIEAGALRPDRHEVDVDELVGDTVSRLERLVSDRPVVVEIEPLPEIRGDYTQLSQVLTNLLENAVRHAPEDSAIRIGGCERDGFVEIWVDDEGAGVPPAERERIFEAFRRGEGSSSSGIGLAICKAIVEAHGGRISVGDAPGGGARFTFAVPSGS